MGREILVVDDDQAIRTMLVMNLQLEGYDTREAADGIEALDLVEQAMPDLMILDVMMPNLDGLDVLSRLRADPKTQTIPVIVLSARSSNEDQWEGWSKGADYYVTKPFDVEEVLRFIRFVFEGAK